MEVRNTLGVVSLSICLISCNGPDLLQTQISASDEAEISSEGSIEFSYLYSSGKYEVLKPIEENRPVFRVDEVEVSPEIDSYEVEPTLPTGIHFDVNTGTISGSSTAEFAQQEFVVTATSSEVQYKTTLTLSAILSLSDDFVYEPTEMHFDKDVAIEPIFPSYSGFIESFSVFPPFTNGLKIDEETGVITGTPSDYAAKTLYIVAGSNDAGNVTAAFSIEILPTPNPKDFQYDEPDPTYILGDFYLNIPSYEGIVDYFSIEPDLTAKTGLSFHEQSGAIYGYTSQLSAPVTYTVTAHYKGTIAGQFYITIEVVPGQPPASDGGIGRD